MSTRGLFGPRHAASEAARRAETERLRDALQRVVGQAVTASTDEAHGRGVVEGLADGVQARSKAAASRAHALQTSAHHGERQHDQPSPESVAQGAKPPSHLTWNEKKEQIAERLALESASRAGRRELVYWPAWARELARRCCESKGRALSELTAIPKWASASVLKEAAAYGGADAVAGRNLIALSLVLWHVGGRLRGRISGMPREAYTSLTTGPNGKHYSDSAVWHPVHHADGELLPDARGPEGGRIGAGRNRGFMVAIRLAGWMRTVVPASYGLAPWLIAPSGWPYVQVIVRQSDTS